MEAWTRGGDGKDAERKGVFMRMTVDVAGLSAWTVLREDDGGAGSSLAVSAATKEELTRRADRGGAGGERVLQRWQRRRRRRGGVAHGLAYLRTRPWHPA